MIEDHFPVSDPSFHDEDSDQQSEQYIKGPSKPLTVTFRNLTLTTKENGQNYGPTVLSEINPKNWIPWKRSKTPDRVRFSQETVTPT